MARLVYYSALIPQVRTMETGFRHRARGLALWLGILVAALACWADRPMLAQAGPLVIPVRVVNGHVFMLTDFQGLRYTNEASFEISFEYPDALTLHQDQYDWVGINPNDLGLGEPARVHVRVEPGV